MSWYSLINSFIYIKYINIYIKIFLKINEKLTFPILCPGGSKQTKFSNNIWWDESVLSWDFKFEAVSGIKGSTNVHSKQETFTLKPITVPATALK